MKRHLLCDYDSEIRPGHSNNATIIRINYIIKSYDYVSFNKFLLKVKIYFDYFQNEDAQTLTVTSWMTMSWNDDGLKWNPSDYSDLTVIHASSDLIWTPQLHLYNGYTIN